MTVKPIVYKVKLIKQLPIRYAYILLYQVEVIAF
ncbi:MAG: hypothetical protein [Malazfec virus 3]